MSDSVFTKIINGEIPSHKVYEDDKTLAFMDIHPVQPGMVLVVPKAQVPHFFDLQDGDYQALWNTVKKVAIKMKNEFPDKERIGIQVEGLDEKRHAHIKLIPVNSGDEFRQMPNDGEPDHAELAKMAEKLQIA
jgi:histidine triad (HIT) family protein